MRGLPDPQPRTEGHEGVSHRQVWPDALCLCPALYSSLLLTEKLLPHLAEIDAACREQMETMEKAMMKQEGVTEALKAADQMEWVRRMNSLHSRAEETVLHDLISDG